MDTNAQTEVKRVEILDTTLRDGAQGEGISFSLLDKLAIVKSLSKQGIPLIEAGNPSSNPKDMEFFHRLRDLELGDSSIVAFGATRKKETPIERDGNIQALLEAGTKWVSIFGKCWDLHVREVLRTTDEENLSMIADTVRFFTERGRHVIFDAEHFFDGYAANPVYALRAVRTAWEAGAVCVCLCDTNGAAFPDRIAQVTAEVVKLCPVTVGIHTHDDVGCAVANAMAAVGAGAAHVQGTYIGFGERCGNTNLSTVIANLQLKRGYYCIMPEKLRRLTKTARKIAEICNLALPGGMPYVGGSAFAHKGGMHVDGVCKNSVSFEHLPPDSVGNSRRILLSEFSGRSAVVNRLMGLDESVTRDSAAAGKLIEKLKLMEYEGYAFESAEASFELFALKELGKYKPAFELEYFKLLGEQPARMAAHSCSVIIKVQVGNAIEMTSAEGDGPVHALDIALRKALEVFYPVVSQVRLVDYKVRVLETRAGTAAKVRVLIESSDGEHHWATVGLSTDILEASWQALRDSLEYKLLLDNLL